MRKNHDSRHRPRLRRQLFAAWTLFLTGVAGVLFLAMGTKVAALILQTELEKLRPAAWKLKEACEDYFMSPSDRELTMRFAKILQEFPDISYVFFVDRHGRTLYRGNDEMIASLRPRLMELNPAKPGLNDVKVIQASGETYVNISEMTSTLPPLPVHLGFAKSLTDARTRSLLWNRGAITFVVLAGGLLGGLVVLAWLTEPFIALSADAERLSMGDMNVRLDLKSRGEIGRVYQSLDRLRESIMYALRKLDNEGPAPPQAGRPQRTQPRE